MRASGEFEAMPKKEALLIGRELEKLERNLSGIRDMKKLPDAVFILDTKKEHIGVTEARKLGIPIVAVVDTNCDPDLIQYVIPGNDDAIRAGTLMCRIIADAVEEGRIIAARKGKAAPVAAAAGAPAAAPTRTADDEARIAAQQAEARREAARQAAEREARIAATKADTPAEAPAAEAAAEGQPAAAEDQPAAAEDQPAAAEDQPAAAEDQPTQTSAPVEEAPAVEVSEAPATETATDAETTADAETTEES
jgi:small subunit ribosomal protein S2